MRESGSGDEGRETTGGVPGRRRVGWSLSLGLVTAGVAVAGMGATLLTGWPLGCFFSAWTGAALICLALVSLAALAYRENRRRPRVWHYVGTLVAAVGLLYTVTVGPGNYLKLISLRTRARVAMTGGQEQLQTWAVEVLAKPRDGMRQDVSMVPREEWSAQVRRLGGNVRINPVLDGGRNAICLGYGGGFFHWYIVVGPPGSAPDPNDEREHPFDVWYRWGDGVYGWFPES